eukprot:maker-scaffold309_size213625-snap-gene-0.20 protein:Tk02552 transcript:maker-scaffold309_size213625-snap-gene-0.20-mRNA-1 annotation:"GI10101"
MRWGVRDESTDDHMTTDICLEEIRNCQKSSIGPNFIFLGGQKYGYRPIPNKIDGKEFEMIVKTLRDLGKDDSLFMEWYDMDTNSVPSEMILQPISSLLPNFLNSLAPSLQEADQRAWWKILCTFQNLYREAALYLCKTNQISMERMKSFQHSVVEREVVEGILEVKETKGSSLAFLRRINNLNLSDNKGGLGKKALSYVDIKELKQDKEAAKMMSELSELKIPEKLERSNWKNYEVEWIGLSGHSKEAYDKYMTTFIFDFYKSVIRLIDKAMKKIDSSLRGNMANEILIHLESEMPSGTCEMAWRGRMASQHREKAANWMDSKDVVMVIRFLGTTPNSSNVNATLISICQQICYNLEIPVEEIPEEFVPLKNYFRILLDRAGKSEFQVVILLDALETFFVNSYENGATSWIPKQLPENVKIILTITQGESCLSFNFILHHRDNLDRSILEAGKTSRGQEVDKFLSHIAVEDNENLLPVGEMGPKVAQAILEKWLEEIGRKLSNFQWRVVMNALHICSLPLFVYLCFWEVKHWKSYFLDEETKIPLSIDMTISNKYEHLEHKFGKRLVGHALGLVTASKFGLSESELEDMLCLDDMVLNDVFHSFIPQGIHKELTERIPPILWTKIRREIQHHFTDNEADGVRVLVWAHKQFRHASRRRYLNAPETRKYLHSLMCDYYLGTFSNGKEKPYRYTEMQRQRLKLKDRVGQADRRVPVQPNVFSTDETNGKTRSLLFQCDSLGLQHNCLSPLSHCLSSPGGPLLYSLDGHKFAIFGCSLTNDKRYVVSISTRQDSPYWK